jgi:hypothetical protein
VPCFDVTTSVSRLLSPARFASRAFLPNGSRRSPWSAKLPQAKWNVSRLRGARLRGRSIRCSRGRVGGRLSGAGATVSRAWYNRSAEAAIWAATSGSCLGGRPRIRRACRPRSIRGHGDVHPIAVRGNLIQPGDDVRGLSYIDGALASRLLDTGSELAPRATMIARRTNPANPATGLVIRGPREALGARRVGTFRPEGGA